MNSGPQSERPVLLVIDDIREMRRAVRSVARRHGCEVIEAESGEEGLELLDSRDVTCAFVDHGLPGMLGIDVLRRAVREHPNVAYVLFTAMGDADIGFEAHKLGADYTTKKAGGTEWLVETLHKALLAGQLKRENAELRRAAERSPADRLLLGTSPRMDRLRNDIRSYASFPSQHVLILGESGVGKEVAAKALHAEAGHPGRLVSLNAGAIPADLAESELFGHVKGAFTGATGLKSGAFESAGDGMVFLDEFGELPLPIQAKLLRVLETGTYSRVGSNDEVRFEGRVIAATNQDLEQMVMRGAFRHELRWRFGFTVEVPPLRDHAEDIPVLAMRFLSEHCADSQRNIRAISREAMACLQSYDWRRNNVRELRNAILLAVVNAQGEEIQLEDLPPFVLQAVAPRRGSTAPAPMRRAAPQGAPQPAPVPGGPTLSLSLLDLPYASGKKEAEHAFGRWYVMERLIEHEGNVTRAAEAAGVKRPNFHRLIKRFLEDGDQEEIEEQIRRNRAP